VRFFGLVLAPGSRYWKSQQIVIHYDGDIDPIKSACDFLKEHEGIILQAREMGAGNIVCCIAQYTRPPDSGRGYGFDVSELELFVRLNVELDLPIT
jgi:hypothetical protein